MQWEEQAWDRTAGAGRDRIAPGSSNELLHIFYDSPEDMSRIWEIPPFFLRADMVIYTHKM